MMQPTQVHQTADQAVKNLERTQVWIRKFGAPEKLSVENSKAASSLAPNEVRIDVHFSGINFADLIMRMGLYKDAPARPFVPGYEFSGVVLEIGTAVTNVKVGDRVYAGSVFGGYSSQMVIPSQLALPLPDSMSFEEGAAIPVAFITAHAALFDMARVRKGDKVMIDCATGGVGTLALQMLKFVGADTIGLTSSDSKKALIESYGARAMSHDEFWASKEDRFDFILNSQGGSTIRAHYNRLGPTGRVVCLGISSGIEGGTRKLGKILKTVLTMPKFNIIGMFDQNRGIYALNALRLMEDQEALTKILKQFKLVEEMKLKPHVGAVYSYKEVALAHKLISDRKATGKILLSWK